MTTMESIKTNIEKPGLRRLAPDIAGKLQAAEHQHHELESRRGALALAETMGEAGAGEKLAALNVEITKARARVDHLRAAHTEALDRDARAEANQRATIQQSQFRALQTHVKVQEAAVIEMCRSHEVTLKAYRRAVEATAKIVAAQPLGTVLPMGGILGANQLAALISHEGWRFSGVEKIGDERMAFPGARAPSFSEQYQPDKIEPAVDVVRRAHEYLIATVKGQIEADQAGAFAKARGAA
jgi:hypothetical protein